MSAPTACSSTARTDGSAEVDATASASPPSCASAIDPARRPGAAGRSPCGDHRGVDLGLAPVPARRQPRAVRPRSRAGRRLDELGREQARHPLLAAADPQLRRSPPRSTAPAGRTRANIWLNAGRCPSRSVSASTPSQSKIRARHQRLARAAEAADVSGRHRHDRVARRAGTATAGPTCPWLAPAQEVEARLHERTLSAVEMLTLAQPRAIRS